MNTAADITMELAPDDVIEYIIQADPLNFTAIRCTCRRFSALQLTASISYFINEYTFSRNIWAEYIEDPLAIIRCTFTVLLDDGRPIYIFEKNDVASGAFASFLDATAEFADH